MCEISRKEVLMPGGIELTQEAEQYLSLQSNAKMLSVACGTGELELYLATKYGCKIIGIDIGEWAITRAKKKSTERGLEHLAEFEIGDGNALKFEASTFDVVFCSGAICEIFNNGLKEFHRVLKPKGRAVIIEVIWRREDVPKEIEHCWTGGTAHVLTMNGNQKAFTECGFRTLFARDHHEPSWWEAYYEDRGNGAHWQEEKKNYQKHQDYLGLGLFVLEKV